MLIPGQTTEERIAQIANSFAQGLQGARQGMQSYNKAIQEQNRYEEAKLRQQEAEKRQRAIQELEVEAQLSSQTGKNFVGSGAGKAFLAGSYKPEDYAGLGLTKAAQKDNDAKIRQDKIDAREEKVAQSVINKNNRAGSKAAGTDKVVQKQMEKLGTDNAQLYKVSSAMKEALGQLENKDLSDEEKIKAGQGLLKLLNSAEGSDAVGAEEAQRLGSYLEYQIANIKNPGPFIGRDIGGFTKQVKNYSELLDGRIKRGQEGIDALRSGKTLDQLSEQMSSEREELERLRALKRSKMAGG